MVGLELGWEGIVRLYGEDMELGRGEILGL